MMIAVPYVQGMLRQETSDSLPAEAYLYRVERQDDYFWLLDALWRARKDFLVWEQDIVATPEDIQMMQECPHYWCAAPYMVAREVQPCLGFTRFRSELQEAFTDLFLKVEEDDGDQPPRCWWRLDVRIKQELEKEGFKMHIHGEVSHFHGA